jgi:bifunctional oligoribonuclease and PAP phosphatase NrnA
MLDWSRFCHLIHQARNVVLTSHIRPDCDALGSLMGMARILESLGKQVQIVCSDPVPPNLAFIDPEFRIKQIGVDVQAEEISPADMLMILDTSAWIQLGKMADVVRNFSGKLLLFDHHVGEDDIPAELFKNTSAEAVGRMCVEAAEHLNVPLTPEIAQPLLAALATDTGWFRFQSVTEITFETAAKLLRGGANPAKLYADLYERETVGRTRLRGLVLSRLQVELDGRLAHTYILPDDYGKMGALPSDTEDLINLALGIEGVVFAVILVGLRSGGFKISFRSRSQTSANEVAREFGGGGHKAAAGASIVESDFQDVQHRVLSHVRHVLAEEFEAV